MSNSPITKHLPYLRRYARALTGSQQRGDQYVRICLETLLQQPATAVDAPAPRRELYRLFHEVWSRIAATLIEGEASEGADRGRLEATLMELPARERQILLLTSVEGFPVEDAAYVLGIDETEAEDLLDFAREDLNKQTSTGVLVIEDEPVIAFDIVGIVSEMGHHVVGTAATKAEAVELAKARRPGIVLADIRLSDGSSGIDAAAEIVEAMNVPVVFVTAYPERLLTGERKEPVYLVTKPFEPDVLKVTIYQALLASPRYSAPPATEGIA